MKKFFLLPFLALFFILDTNAQTLTMQPSTKLYGYKNSDGGWQIAPQFQYAYAFQGHFRRFAVVKLDRFWGCIDVRGQMVVRNIFHTSQEAEAAGKEPHRDETGSRGDCRCREDRDLRGGDGR